MDEIDDDLAYAEATDPEEDDSEPDPKVSVPDDLLATTVAGDEGTTEEDVGPQEPVSWVSDSLDWGARNISGPVNKALGLTGDGLAGAVADKPGEAPPNVLDKFTFGDKPFEADPETDKHIAAALKARGYSDEDIQSFFAMGEEGRGLALTAISKPPTLAKPPKAPIMDPEHEAAYRAELKRILPPELAGLVDSTPLSALGNLASSGASKILNPPKPPKPGVAKIDREAAYRAYPQLRAYGPGLSDAAISSFFAKRLEEQTKAQAAGGMQYKAKPNTNAIKIKNDDAFKRSGLKTGDVVCIRIP